MSQTDAGWGAGPSGRYEAMADRFRAVFAEIRATAVERDRARRLPHAEIGWLREAKFTTLRLAPAAGGHGASLPEVFALLIELSTADSHVTRV
jgi:alkylation response protein AidB-like acyl-CoA dehydrogenase